VRLLPEFLERSAQVALLGQVRAALALAPPVRPTMPGTGQPFSVRQSNCGPLGWVSDQAGGYRYQATHPVTGSPWPAIPPALMTLWEAVSGCPDLPECCLINLYDAQARMGLHVDADEAARDAPVVSVSLGDTCRFRLGGPMRSSPTRSFRLASGDVMVLDGPSRHWFHGVDRILPGSSTLIERDDLLPAGGRISLTLRRVT
jgi:DNA oxidative demethylase